MNKIPTAEEFLDLKLETGKSYGDEELKDWLIEFAKLHVEAALEAANENAEVVFDVTFEEYTSYVEENSILNAYPLENIK